MSDFSINQNQRTPPTSALSSITPQPPAPQTTGFIDALYMLLGGDLGPVSPENTTFMAAFAQLIQSPDFLNALKTSKNPQDQDLYDLLVDPSTVGGGKSLVQAAQEYANGSPTDLTNMVNDPNSYSFFHGVSNSILHNYSGLYNYQFPGSADDKAAFIAALQSLGNSGTYSQLLSDFNSGNIAAAQADAKALGTSIDALYQLVSNYPNDGFSILIKNAFQTVFGQGTSIESIAQEFKAGNYTHLADFCYFLKSGLPGSGGLSGANLLENLSYYTLKYGSL